MQGANNPPSVASPSTVAPWLGIVAGDGQSGTGKHSSTNQTGHTLVSPLLLVALTGTLPDNVVEKRT